MNYYMIDPKDKSLDRGDLRALKEVYDKINPPEKIEKAKMSLSHPYKTVEQVEAALKHDPSHPHDALSKMSSSLRKDPDAMIRMVAQTEQAYSYVHPSINDNDLKVQMVRINPNVYAALPQESKSNSEIAFAYKLSMFNNMREAAIGRSMISMQFKNQFDPHMDARKVLSPLTYLAAYDDLVANGVYERNGRTLDRNFALVAACRLLNKDDAPQFDENERKVWARHPEKVVEWAREDRRVLEVNNTLTAIENIAPQYTQLIAEIQKERWRERQQELLDIKRRQEAGMNINGHEQSMLKEAEKHIFLNFSQPSEPQQLPQLNDLRDKELKDNLMRIETEVREREKLQERVQIEREENLAYLIQDSKTRILSAAANGDITPDMASDILGYLGSMPLITTSSRAQTVLETTEAMENNIDNIDMDLQFSDPTLSEIPTIDQQMERREFRETRVELSGKEIEMSDGVEIESDGFEFCLGR